MSNKKKSKLFLTDNEEPLYIFRKNILEPIIVYQDINVEDDIDFIISFNNNKLKFYLECLKNKEYEKVQDIRRVLFFEDISNDLRNDLNKLREVETIVVNNTNINLIEADNIIPNSFEVTFNEDFKIVKSTNNFRPYLQTIESSKGLFENSVLFKAFLEEHLDIELQYFSFYKYKSDSEEYRLYVDFVSNDNIHYFIEDNLLFDLTKQYFTSFKTLYNQKSDINYKNDAIFLQRNYQIVYNNIIKVLNELNEQNKDYLSSKDTSFIFNCSLSAFACANNPYLTPALVLLPLSEELAVASINKFMTDTLNLNDDYANFVSKTSYFLFKSGLSNLDIDIVDIILKKGNMDESFLKALEESKMDTNLKKLIKDVYIESRSADFDNLSLFQISQIAVNIQKELSLQEYIFKTIKDTITEYSKDLSIDVISTHSTYIGDIKSKEDNLKIEEKKQLNKRIKTNQYDSGWNEL